MLYEIYLMSTVMVLTYMSVYHFLNSRNVYLIFLQILKSSIGIFLYTESSCSLHIVYLLLFADFSHHLSQKLSFLFNLDNPSIGCHLIVSHLIPCFGIYACLFFKEHFTFSCSSFLKV